jgi:4-hydroxy-tetrahydrodipicolinate reductase
MAVRIAIAGAGGRMGQALIETTLATEGLALASAFDVPGSAAVDCDAGERFGRVTGVIIGADPEAAARAADVLIDFTRPEGTLAHLAAAARHGTGAVVGTTGLSPQQKAELGAYAQKIPVVFAPNMSVGVNVLLTLVETAARRLGADYDIEILEMHHRHKVDAPSGTALGLGEAAARGSGRVLADCAVFAREGVTGERPPGAIGFAALRGGDVVGEPRWCCGCRRAGRAFSPGDRGRTLRRARCALRGSWPRDAEAGLALPTCGTCSGSSEPSRRRCRTPSTFPARRRW